MVVVTTEWIRPESLSTSIWTYRFAGLRLYPVVPLVALLGLVHLWIALPLFVLGGTGRRDQGGINDCALPHRHAPSTEVSFDGFQDLLAQLVLLQQVEGG